MRVCGKNSNPFRVHVLTHNSMFTYIYIEEEILFATNSKQTFILRDFFLPQMKSTKFPVFSYLIGLFLGETEPPPRFLVMADATTF